MAAFKRGVDGVELFFCREKKFSARRLARPVHSSSFVSRLPQDNSTRSIPLPFQFQGSRIVAIMFKPTQPMMVRLRLTTKQVNGGYYKGNRTGSMGHFDKRGTYRPDMSKHRIYIPAQKLEIPGKKYSGETAKEPFTVSIQNRLTPVG